MRRGDSTERTSVHRLYSHFIWCPKCRKSVLTGEAKDRLEALIEEKASELDLEILALTARPDHVHLFIEGNPKLAPNKIMQQINGYSSRRMREEFDFGLPPLWTRSYFVSSAEDVADETAALDIGANNIIACTTTTGQQYLYEGRDLFERFRETTRTIAEQQSKVKREEGRYTSKRIRRLYRRRTRRRDHAMDALDRDLFERLYEEGVATVYVGDFTDVLDTHWSVRANQKAHNFWAFRAFIDRLACTAEEFGITVEVRPEACTSQECPQWGSRENTTRHQETLTCSCGFEGHADLRASETFLRRHEIDVPRPMARSVCLTWDDHTWSASSRAHRPNEEHTDQSIRRA